MTTAATLLPDWLSVEVAELPSLQLMLVVMQYTSIIIQYNFS